MPRVLPPPVHRITAALLRHCCHLRRAAGSIQAAEPTKGLKKGLVLARDLLRGKRGAAQVVMATVVVNGSTTAVHSLSLLG